MSEHHLTTPLTEAQVRELRVGDTVTLDGVVFGIRDATVIRIFDEAQAPPVDLRGGVCLHTAPNVKKAGGRYEPLSVGTTTSMRMDRFTGGLLERYGVRAVIGKGGPPRKTLKQPEPHTRPFPTVSCGAAALETTQI